MFKDDSTAVAGENATHPIVARLKFTGRVTDDSIKYWRLKTENLRIHDYADRYRERILSRLPAIKSMISSRLDPSINRSSSCTIRQRVVDHMEHDLVKFILDVARETLGAKPVPVTPKSASSSDSSSEYLQTRQELSAVYASLLRFNGQGLENPRVADLMERRNMLRTRLDRLDALDRSNSYHDWKKSFIDLPPTDKLKILNRCMRRRAAAGACLSSTPNALSSYKDHYQAQFTNSFGIAPYVPDYNTTIDDATAIAVASRYFSVASVSECIMKSPKGKAPGISGLTADLLHPIVDLISPILSMLFCTYMTLSMVPSSWKRALLCPVPKKGDLSRISNYRPISLTEITRKIYEMCLLSRLQSEITLSREQGGFRTGRSTIDQVQCLDAVVKAIRVSGRSVHMAFLDIKAAYDSVPRGELWRRCVDIGLDAVSIESLRSLFDHNSAQLVLSQKRSPPFSLSAGVLQGSVLSPLLYSIYLDPLVDSLRSHGPSVNIPGSQVHLNALLYADDIALIASSCRDLARLLRLAEEDSLLNRLQFQGY